MKHIRKIEKYYKFTIVQKPSSPKLTPKREEKEYGV
ncbi:MAG: hypothetical protein KatS3mg027_1008 [Bacteroidia bacterium]|nr:MAG: hypothetical protein KatS3mg027_1008 [Bacteroidia bacterium]